MITEDDHRRWLETIEDYGVRNIHYGPERLGLIGVSIVTKIGFRPHDRKRGQHGFTLARPFYWEARMEFEDCDGERWNLHCTDIRWKTYLWDRIYKQDQNAKEICDHLLTFLNDAHTFLVVEIHPPDSPKQRRRIPGTFRDRTGHYAVVGGIISIPDWHRRISC